MYTMSSGFGLEEATSEGEESTLRPRSHDVLSGRGNYVNYHPGNEHFRNLVKKYKKAYVACPKAQKGKYSRLIVDQIFSMDPPGRFLKKDLETKQWGDIGEKKALDKTRQALREGAPDLVKELGTVASDEEPDPVTSIEDPIPYESFSQQTRVDNYAHESHSQVASYHCSQLAGMHMQARAQVQAHQAQAQAQAQAQEMCAQAQARAQAQNNNHASNLYSQPQPQRAYPQNVLSAPQDLGQQYIPQDNSISRGLPQDLGQQYIPQSNFSMQPQEIHSMSQFTPLQQTPNTATPDHTDSAFVSGLDTNSVKVSYRAQQFEPTPIDQMVQNNVSAQYGQNDLITVCMPLPGKAEEDKDAADQNKEDMRETGSASTASLKVSDLDYRNPKHEESSGNMSFSITDLEKGNLSSMFTDSLIITTSGDDDESSFSGRISSEKSSGSTILSEGKELPSHVQRPSYLKKVPCNQSSSISGLSFAITGGMSGSTDLLDSVQHMSFTNFDDSLRTDNKRTDS